MADQANLAQLNAHDYLAAIKGRAEIVTNMSTALQNGAPLDPRQLSAGVLSLAALVNEFLRVLQPAAPHPVAMEAIGSGPPPSQPPGNQNGLGMSQ